MIIIMTKNIIKTLPTELNDNNDQKCNKDFATRELNDTNNDKKIIQTLPTERSMIIVMTKN